MKIGVLGLGYVGITTASCLAKMGHEVIGVEVNKEKLSALVGGTATIIEPNVGDYLQENNARIKFVSRLPESCELDCLFVCVGTPTNAEGFSDLTALETCIPDLITSTQEATTSESSFQAAIL